MRYLSLLLVLCGASAALAQLADDTCLRRGGEGAHDVSLRCGASAGGGGGVQALFAADCYTGNGTDGRSIATGIEVGRAGFLRICEITPDAGNGNRCIYKIPGLDAGFSCDLGNSDLDPSGSFFPCGTGFINDFIEGGFELNTGTRVNTTSRPYCYEQWALAPDYHGTLIYTGDGVSPRTITLDSTPSWVLTLKRGTSSSNDNIGYIRSADMPADFSCSISTFDCDTTGAYIAGLGDHSVTVGANRNVSGVTYHLIWWADGPKQGVVDWIGNGTSLDAGRCGSAADHQTVAAPCFPVRNVWGVSWEPADAAETDSACTLISGRNCDYWRSAAVGTAVSGPGNLSSSDFYGFRVTQPNNTAGTTFGNLVATDPGSFDVTGGASGQESCNDLDMHYYGLVTCAPAQEAGADPAGDWTNLNTVAQWNFDNATSALEVAGSTAVNGPNVPIANSGTIACPARQCDLDDTNTVGRSTANALVGDQAADFTAASSQKLGCTLSDDCDELDLGGAGGSITWGCFVRPTADGDYGILTKGVVSGNLHYGLTRGAASDNVTCSLRHSGGLATRASGANTLPVDTWTFAACVFDNTAGTLRTYTEATATTTTAVANDATTDPATNFELGRNVSTAGNYFQGQLDSCFVDDIAYSATSLCRVCSCGISGQLCSCFSTDQTAYVDIGRNETHCGSCTLPACDTVGPS